MSGYCDECGETVCVCHIPMTEENQRVVTPMEEFDVLIACLPEAPFKEQFKRTKAGIEQQLASSSVRIAELEGQLEAAQSRIRVQDEAMQQVEARCAMLEVRAEKWKRAYHESWPEQMTFNIQESDWLARNNNEVLERAASACERMTCEDTGWLLAKYIRTMKTEVKA